MDFRLLKLSKSDQQIIKKATEEDNKQKHKNIKNNWNL